MKTVAVNGIGGIWCDTLKILLEESELSVVAVNDLIAPEILIYFLKYDTVYDRYEQDVAIQGEDLAVGDKIIKLCSKKNPSELTWSKLGVDTVFECIGVFRKQKDLKKINNPSMLKHCRKIVFLERFRGEDMIDFDLRM